MPEYRDPSWRVADAQSAQLEPEPYVAATALLKELHDARRLTSTVANGGTRN